MCTAKKEEGQGVRRIEEWNKAALAKYVCAIAVKQDNLRIR